jgi:hypothetical protein
MKRIAQIVTLAMLTVGLAHVEPAYSIDIEDLDEAGKKQAKKKAKKKKSKSNTESESEEIIREIERGYFVKAGAGMSMYLITYGKLLKGGTVVNLSAGGDFMDREKMSMAWEISISQAVHNGSPWETQAGPNFIQGDTRAFGFTAAYEYSAYPSRRFGVGFRVGAGVVLTPLLMNKAWYQTEVVGGAWGVEAQVHRTPHPIVFAGPTFEYYTKLSHFSIGVDIDAGYAIGLDLGISGTGYMKYTF